MIINLKLDFKCNYIYADYSSDKIGVCYTLDNKQYILEG